MATATKRRPPRTASPKPSPAASKPADDLRAVRKACDSEAAAGASAAAARQPNSAPVTPGGYIRTCRMIAGISLEAAANKVSIRLTDRLTAQRDLAALEANVPGDYGRLVNALHAHAAFPFDFATFVRLAAETCAPSLDGWEE